MLLSVEMDILLALPEFLFVAIAWKGSTLTLLVVAANAMEYPIVPLSILHVPQLMSALVVSVIRDITLLTTFVSYVLRPLPLLSTAE